MIIEMHTRTTKQIEDQVHIRYTNHHTNMNIINKDSSEYAMLTEAYRIQEKRPRTIRKEKFVNQKSKDEFLTMKMKANAKFENDTIVKFRAI